MYNILTDPELFKGTWKRNIIDLFAPKPYYYYVKKSSEDNVA